MKRSDRQTESLFCYSCCLLAESIIGLEFEHRLIESSLTSLIVMRHSKCSLLTSTILRNGKCYAVLSIEMSNRQMCPFIHLSTLKNLSPALTLVQLFPHPFSVHTIISCSLSNPLQPIYTFPQFSRILILSSIC